MVIIVTCNPPQGDDCSQHDDRQGGTTLQAVPQTYQQRKNKIISEAQDCEGLPQSRTEWHRIYQDSNGYRWVFIIVLVFGVSDPLCLRRSNHNCSSHFKASVPVSLSHLIFV